MILAIVILATLCQIITALVFFLAVLAHRNQGWRAGGAVLFHAVLPLVMLWVLFWRLP